MIMSYWSLSGDFSSKADDTDRVADLLCRKSGFNFPTRTAFSYAGVYRVRWSTHFTDYLSLAVLVLQTTSTLPCLPVSGKNTCKLIL